MEVFLQKALKAFYYAFAVGVLICLEIGFHFTGNLPIWACAISILGLFACWFWLDWKFNIDNILFSTIISALSFALGYLFCALAGYECFAIWKFGLGAAIVVAIKLILTLVALLFNWKGLISGDSHLYINSEKLSKKAMDFLSAMAGFSIALILIWFMSLY